MTLTEAAEALGLSAATLRQQIAKGRLQAHKIGPIWVVTAEEIERYRSESRGRPGRRYQEPGRLAGEPSRATPAS